MHIIITVLEKLLRLNVEESDTVLSVKEQIETHEGIPIIQQELIHNQIILDNYKSLSDYEIRDPKIFMSLLLKNTTLVAKKSPDYLVICKGMNYCCKCSNPDCATQKNGGEFIIQKGIGDFDITRDKEEPIVCPICGWSSVLDTLGLFGCKYMVSGKFSLHPADEFHTGGFVSTSRFKIFKSGERCLNDWINLEFKILKPWI